MSQRIDVERLWFLFCAVLFVCLILLIATIVLIGTFGKPAATIILFLFFLVVVAGPFVESHLSANKAEVSLPPSVVVDRPFELRAGRFETRVRMDSEDWLGTMADDGRPPPAVGERVSVVGRSGLELHLERNDHAT